MPSKDTIERIRMLQAWYVDDVSYLIYDTMNNIYVCVCVYKISTIKLPYTFDTMTLLILFSHVTLHFVQEKS